MNGNAWVGLFYFRKLIYLFSYWKIERGHQSIHKLNWNREGIPRIRKKKNAVGQNKFKVENMKNFGEMNSFRNLLVIGQTGGN